jgi:hypothetical protein
MEHMIFEKHPFSGSGGFQFHVKEYFILPVYTISIHFKIRSVVFEICAIKVLPFMYIVYELFHTNLLILKQKFQFFKIIENIF